MEYISKSEKETYKIAFDFVSNSLLEGGLQGANMVGLYGELGAGKTTFMKGVAKYFGIIETIQSPTFVIEKIYEIENNRQKTIDKKFKHLIHIDAYRIEKSNEMINLGWNEIIADPENLIFVEWPERIIDIMPKHSKIYFEHLNIKGNDSKRKVTIK